VQVVDQEIVPVAVALVRLANRETLISIVELAEIVAKHVRQDQVA